MEEPKIYDFTQPNSTAAATDFSKFLIDLSKDIKEPQPLISLAEKPLFTRGNVSCISGKAKSRKTFLIGLFSAQFLEYGDKAKIIIFDTEQAQFHVQKSTKRIHKLLDWSEQENCEQLRVFALRELSTKERLEFVKQAIQHFRPDFIFIDGIRDLLLDFNNIAESSDLVNLLMNLSSVYNCHICAVLHENKGDNSLRGHAGTELQNKSETVISVEADGDTSAVSPKYCRNLPFEKFWFKINDEGLPEYCEPDMKPKGTDVLQKLFDELLPKDTTLSYAELRNKVMERCGVKNRAAEYKIKTATDERIIIKNNVGNYYLFIPEYVEKTANDLPF